MSQDEIVEMARQAGFLINELHCSPPILSFSGQENSMEAFAKLVAAKEREACAKVCEERISYWQRDDIRRDEDDQCSAAIRARGEA